MSTSRVCCDQTDMTDVFASAISCMHDILAVMVSSPCFVKLKPLYCSFQFSITQKKRISKITYHHGRLAWRRIQIKTSIEYCLSFTFKIRMMTFTSILFFQSPDNGNNHCLIFLTFFKSIITQMTKLRPVRVTSPNLCLKLEEIRLMRDTCTALQTEKSSRSGKHQLNHIENYKIQMVSFTNGFTYAKSNMYIL